MSVAKHNAGLRLTTDEIFRAHEGGKLSTQVRFGPLDARTLSIISTPGVASVSHAIAVDPALASKYTWAHRLVAVVSDGTAVLGLGNVGARAALPVMEAKASLFKALGGLDSIPLVVESEDVDEIVATLRLLRPSFGAINLEDVAAPRCFELETALIEALDCPVMHNDQHGTAIVVLAALRGALKVVGKRLASARVVVAGAGAAGIACARILLRAGADDVTILDSRGVVYPGRGELNPAKAELATRTNSAGIRGGITEALPDADVFIGVSSAHVADELVPAMAKDPIVFALSNPTPEIGPDVASRHAAVYATGRSDLPNQVSNLLACPGIFRGALAAGARRITEEMKLAAAEAIEEVAAEDLCAERIIPSTLDPRVAPEVAHAVSSVAASEGCQYSAARS